MLPGIDIIAMTGLLMLAGGQKTACAVPKAPSIVVNPVTKPIEYDFSKSEKELGAFGSDTVNPYAPGTDVATGGLRHDQPKTKLEVSWGHLQYPSGLVCLWYETVKLTIELQPKIYVAKENDSQVCRDAILAHEKKHVEVDRRIINKYAQAIGKAMQSAVNQAGALGPYQTKEHVEAAQKQLVEHIKSAISSQELFLHKDMKAAQGEVDTLEEYERVSKICHDAEKKKKD